MRNQILLLASLLIISTFANPLDDYMNGFLPNLQPSQPVTDLHACENAIPPVVIAFQGVASAAKAGDANALGDTIVGAGYNISNAIKICAPAMKGLGQTLQSILHQIQTTDPNAILQRLLNNSQTVVNNLRDIVAGVQEHDLYKAGAAEAALFNLLYSNNEVSRVVRQLESYSIQEYGFVLPDFIRGFLNNAKTTIQTADFNKLGDDILATIPLVQDLQNAIANDNGTAIFDDITSIIAAYKQYVDDSIKFNTEVYTYMQTVAPRFTQEGVVAGLKGFFTNRNQTIANVQNLMKTIHHGTSEELGGAVANFYNEFIENIPA